VITEANKVGPANAQILTGYPIPQSEGCQSPGVGHQPAGGGDRPYATTVCVARLPASRECCEGRNPGQAAPSLLDEFAEPEALRCARQPQSGCWSSRHFDVQLTAAGAARRPIAEMKTGEAQTPGPTLPPRQRLTAPGSRVTVNDYLARANASGLASCIAPWLLAWGRSNRTVPARATAQLYGCEHP